MSQILSAMTSKFLFIMRASGSSSERESKVRRICAIERVYQDIKFGQKTLEACNCDLRSKNAGQSRGKRNKTAPILCKCDITKQAQPSLAQLAPTTLTSVCAAEVSRGCDDFLRRVSFSRGKHLSIFLRGSHQAHPYYFAKHIFRRNLAYVHAETGSPNT